ncbi:MAG: heparinase II/III family protein [Cyclobacteriaceae bacterium]
MKAFNTIISLGLAILFGWSAEAALKKEIPNLENPISVEYLKKNLSKDLPRLVLNKKLGKNLKKKLKSDPLIKGMYAAIKFNANMVLEKDIISVDIPDNKRSQRNQLGISRDFLHRVNMLSMVYYLEKDEAILSRINEEVIAACNFPTWNPKHYLDVGEMSLAIALAIDWTAGSLPESTIKLAKTSLIEKGIKPSWPDDGDTLRWVYGTNNWNQVCNAGMIAASLSVAEIEPELAAKTIKRSIDGMANALVEYGSDGAYPEGAVYWGYGTQFSVTTAAIFESAFGTNFGIEDYRGFKESAVFRTLSTAPSGRLFNYADCAEKPERYTDFTLSWFATKTGNRKFLNEEKFLKSPEEIGRISRLAGAGIVWTAQFEEKPSPSIPTAWKGDGANPIVIFTGDENDSKGFYFGGKGGRGTVNHGNMDGGSFIFELNGVRWAIDPGNQSYGVLERAGFNLWGRCQECDRWKLLTKSNFGHSTISVNNQLHVVDGLATIESFKDGAKPEVTFDMTPTFAGQLESAKRRFLKESSTSMLIEDDIQMSEDTQMVTWQMMTQADVQIVGGGAILNQDGQQLKLENLSHPEITVSVISLNPAPMALDKEIEGLKRLEIRIPAWLIESDKTKIQVRLSED